MSNSKQFKINKYTKILLPASSYNLETDRRLLIPFTSGRKIGFINKQGEIIVNPQYAMYDGDAYSVDEYIKVAVINTYGFPRSNGNVSTYDNTMYGIIDCNGKVVFEPIYRSLLQSIEGCKLLYTAQNMDYQWGVIDINGKRIIPFGKYSWIDGFDHGYARVKNGKQASNIESSANRWGIINELGEEILPIEYNTIWNFYDKSRYSTHIEKDGKSDEFQIRSNPSYKKTEKYHDYDDSYGEYAGNYAQDVMGYSDDVINDAFEGDPDAYWNID